jgi:hypothetical protein
MIVRLWHGRVAATKARAYREFLTRRAIPDYRSVEGNISVCILERHKAAQPPPRRCLDTSALSDVTVTVLSVAASR